MLGKKIPIWDGKVLGWRFTAGWKADLQKVERFGPVKAGKGSAE